MSRLTRVDIRIYVGQDGDAGCRNYTGTNLFSLGRIIDWSTSHQKNVKAVAAHSSASLNYHERRMILMSYASAYEQYMLELINAERAKVGAQPLAFNTYLNDASEDHTAWMLSSGNFSHTGAGGTSPGTRMQQAGYNFTGSWGWGENIAWRSLGAPAGYADDVYALHVSLMNSSGHRANILNASYKEAGIGFEVGQFG